MQDRPPANISEFIQAGSIVHAELREFKSKTLLSDYGWYPYESLSALPVLAELIAPLYNELAPTIWSKPVVDLGCADGDWAVLFSQLGASTVDAIDHLASNFNQMRGVATLQKAFVPLVRIHDIDLDGPLELPRDEYGFALFLGTLYHLKNPFYLLEKLAMHCDWCVMSTRIAQVTPGGQARIENEAVAYLLGPREVNNDPTNFWIFSPVGLTRILERTGWMIVNEKRLGCTVDSDPVNPRADERIFVLLKSRSRYPELHVRPLSGWYEIEQDRWRWTAKKFSLEVKLPKAQPASEFALRFTVPEAVLKIVKTVRLSCHLEDDLVGSILCDRSDPIEFRGKFPPTIETGCVLKLDFSVVSTYYCDDSRDLGVLVPLLNSRHANTHRIPFRIS